MIIKSFNDLDLVITLGGNDNDFWKWGLTNNGDIVVQSSLFEKNYDLIVVEDISKDEWVTLDYLVNIPWNLKIMKRLIKEFDHLVIFI